MTIHFSFVLLLHFYENDLSKLRKKDINIIDLSYFSAALRSIPYAFAIVNSIIAAYIIILSTM